MRRRGRAALVTFYHDIEQDLDSDADPNRCREVVRGFLALERRYAIRATYNVAGKLFAEQPDLIDWIARDGHELAFHSYDHPPDWSPKYYADQIDRCRALSDSIPGYRSPRSRIDPDAIARLWTRGFLWNAEGDRRPEPYFIHRGLVRLPIATDDWPLHCGRITAEQHVEQFSKLLVQQPYVAVGAHDSMASAAPTQRLALWEEFLRIAARAEAQTVTFAEAADLFRRTALAQYYTRTAADWNRATERLYRTRRFQEIIRAEAGRLVRPVVVDLGSGGGVLSRPLQADATRVYCVDNAPGMVRQVGAADRLHGRLGEATDSGLPSRCADLVICARVVEYLFWPQRLADEIRRVAKPGATYVVTFPAARGTSLSGDGPAPDRVRRYFDGEEIRRWADPIGPGRLIGVQYEECEPADSAAEQRYRRIEADPPPEQVPTNWVYVGTVAADRDGDPPQHRVVPLTAAHFRLASDRPQRIRALQRRLIGLLPNRMRELAARARGRRAI